MQESQGTGFRKIVGSHPECSASVQRTLQDLQTDWT